MRKRKKKEKFWSGRSSEKEKIWSGSSSLVAILDQYRSFRLKSIFNRAEPAAGSGILFDNVAWAISAN